MYKLALVSVSDKTGLAEFLSPLVKDGLTIVSTGGTAEYLKKNNIPVKHVSEITGFPEVMDGRVRTLHPRVHMSLLARVYDPDDMALLKKEGLTPFDLVIGNLYPFEKSLEENLDEREQAEYIDIGGPCLLRAAAKSYDSITVICDPSDYEWISVKKSLTLDERRQLAAKVFVHVSAYDAMISEHLGRPLQKDFSMGGALVDKLRYGENPQQEAYWYRSKGDRDGLHTAEFLNGKQLSYNNIVDLDAAVKTLQEFEEPCVVGVKHNNPCGVAVAKSGLEAIQKAIKADPISIFGGIVAVNVDVSLDMAKELDKIFLECIIAPSFQGDALDVLKKKKNLRLLQWKNIRKRKSQLEVKTVQGGVLVQTSDVVGNWDTNWKVVGENPNEAVKKDLLFAWKVCAHLKSNAIAIGSGGQTLGLGMGQVNRVEAVDHAVGRMSQHHKNFKGELVLASDAFFPFADSMERIHAAGIKWVIQPGGSVRDEEVLNKARECGITVVLTGRRHFYH